MLHNFFSGDMDGSRRRASPPPQSTIDISMGSPTMSMATGSSIKRSGPSSPQEKRLTKKHRKEDSNLVASQFDWMTPLASSIAGAKATASSTSANIPSSQDAFAFIHVEFSCMYYYPYETCVKLLTLS